MACRQSYNVIIESDSLPNIWCSNDVVDNFIKEYSNESVELALEIKLVFFIAFPDLVFEEQQRLLSLLGESVENESDSSSWSGRWACEWPS